MNANSSIAETMVALANDAVALARSVAGCNLDFSEESIRRVEEILGKMHVGLAKANPPREVIEQVCNVYGAYIGEVMRRNEGGDWFLDEKVLPGEKIAALRVGSLQTSPSAKVFKRIMNGPEDDVWFYYRVLSQQFKEINPS